MSNKLSLQMSGFAEMAEIYEKMGGDIEELAETTLKETHGAITNDLETDIARHKRTGRTERSLNKDGTVRWEGTTAVVEIGFRINEGGIASIMLMYGTPRIPKDQKLYNDVFGAKPKRKMKEIQERELNKLMNR